MSDALLATAAALVLAAAALAVLAVLTLAPFSAALTLAEHRGYSPTRWGAFAAAGILLGLGCAAVLLRSGLPAAYSGIGVVPAWLAPLALVLLGSDGGRLAGSRGRHE